MTQSTTKTSSKQESRLEYPSTDMLLDELGNIFDLLNGSELRCLNEKTFVGNDSVSHLPDVGDILAFLEKYPFFYVAGYVEGDPTGPDPQLYVTQIGYSDLDAIPCDKTINDVSLSDLRADFFGTFGDARRIMVEDTEFSAQYD